MHTHTHTHMHTHTHGMHVVNGIRYGVAQRGRSRLVSSSKERVSPRYSIEAIDLLLRLPDPVETSTFTSQTLHGEATQWGFLGPNVGCHSRVGRVGALDQTRCRGSSLGSASFGIESGMGLLLKDRLGMPPPRPEIPNAFLDLPGLELL